jgi:protein O-mannosyl-transferase
MIKTLKPLLLTLALVVAVALLYGQFLSSPLVFDDLPFFKLDADGKLPIDIQTFGLLQSRSLPYVSLTWTKALFGDELQYLRAGNLLLHAAVVLLVFFFLRTLFFALLGGKNQNVLAAKGIAPIGLSPTFAAFFAALVFALHPVATYATGYLVQRTTLMATLFSLLAMLTYLVGSLKQKAPLLWASVPFYFFAVFSKEHAIMLPSVLVALTVLLHADWLEKLKQRWPIFAAHTVVAILILLTVKGIIGSVYEIYAEDFLPDFDRKWAYPFSVMTQCWLFFKYMFLWIFPNSAWMSIDMREPFARAFFSPYLIAALAFLTWGVGAIWLLLQRGRAGLLGFAMLFPWFMFFTEFSTVRIQEVFVLYRSYLWAVGAFCVLPLVFELVNRRLAAFILCTVALALVPISMERLQVLSNLLFVWDDAEKLVHDHPDASGAYRIYMNRGNEYQELGAIDKAQSDFKKAIELNPKFGGAIANLAGTYTRQGDWTRAVTTYKEAIEIDGKRGRVYAMTYGNLGISYIKLMDWKDAADAFTVAIDVALKNDKSPQVNYLFGRAQAYEHLGDLQKSQADYKLACELAKKGCDKLK